MKTTYVGGEKFIARGARVFRITDESAQAATDAEWADGVLAVADEPLPNGRRSHEVASEVLEKAEDVLLNYLVVRA